MMCSTRKDHLITVRSTVYVSSKNECRLNWLNIDKPACRVFSANIRSILLSNIDQYWLSVGDIDSILVKYWQNLVNVANVQAALVEYFLSMFGKYCPPILNSIGCVLAIFIQCCQCLRTSVFYQCPA